MCQKIDSNFVLIHELRKRSTCSISDLVNKKHRIESQIPSVFVDVSKSSILSTIDSYPQIFTWVDNKIARLESAKQYFEEPLISFFDADLKNNVKEEITTILEFDH
jgi:hypothetical protein